MTFSELTDSWNSGTELFDLSSSGSTGKPKVIQLEKKWLTWSALQTAKALKLGKKEKILCCIPTDKIGGFMMLVRAIVLNYPISVKTPKADPMLKLETKHDFTFVSLVAYQIENIFKNQQSIEKLNRFKHILVGGTSLSQQTEAKLCLLNSNVWHTYGMTETYSHIALRKIEKNKPSNFYLLPDVQIKSNTKGCLAIQAPFTQKHWLHTKDIVTINKDNSFCIEGRTDFIINSGGIKINPEKIEHIIRMYFPHQTILVVGVPDIELGNKAILVVEGKEKLPDNWKEIIKKEINKNHIPRYLINIQTIPIGSTGKPDRKKTAELVSLQLNGKR